MNPNHLAFWALSALTIFCALGVVCTKKVFHSGLALVGSLLGVAGIYAILGCPFMAGLQVLVYIGAIAMLLMFAIMLTQNMMTPTKNTVFTQPIAAFLVCSVLLGIMVAAVRMSNYFTNITPSLGDQTPEYLTVEAIASVEQLGVRLVDTWVLPFEAVSVLILVAMIGAIVIARKEEKLPIPSQAAVSKPEPAAQQKDRQ